MPLLSVASDSLLPFNAAPEWAATGKVTQKIPPAFPTAETISYRADIASMDPAIARGSATTATEMVERPAITGISHLTLFADDFVKSQHFYAEILGWGQAPAGEARPGVRFYANHAQYVELVSPPIPGQLDRFDSVAFSTTDDAETMRQYLRSNGVVVPPALTVDPDGNRSFAVHDPEGNKVVFQQDGDHPPARPHPPAAASARTSCTRVTWCATASHSTTSTRTCSDSISTGRVAIRPIASTG